MNKIRHYHEWLLKHLPSKKPDLRMILRDQWRNEKLQRALNRQTEND